MQKAMQVCIIAGTITLCLSLFLFSDAVAEDGKDGNRVENDALTVVMRGTAIGFPAHPDMTAEKMNDNRNEDYVVPVAGGTASSDKKCGPGAPCLTTSPSGKSAVDGTQCSSGVACLHPGTQYCNYNTGTCTTVNLGGGNCSCACVPN